MKTVLLLTIATFAMTAHARDAVQPDCDLTRLLSAIAAKENQPQDKVGPHGERSIYSISAAVWHDRMPGWPFYVCTEQSNMAKHCAIMQLNWLANECAKAGIHPGVYELGSAWNTGLAGFIKLHSMHVEIQYGRDVENLYTAQKSQS
jgi:hypothetical protein